MNFLFKNELIIVINDKKDKLDLKLDARHFTTVATIQMNVQKTKNCSEGMQNRNSDTFKVRTSKCLVFVVYFDQQKDAVQGSA